MKFSGLMRSDYYTFETQDVARNDCKIVGGLDLKRWWSLKEMTMMT